MTRQNRQKYLKILGLQNNADQKAVRDAFRRLAKKYHPDCAERGEESCERFREIREAYERLGGPDTRKQDDTQRRTRQSPPYRRSRLARPWFSSSWFTLSPQEPDFEISVSPREAALGTSFTLDLPVNTACPRCDGVGLLFFAACPSCRGAGVIRQIKSLTITLPPGLSDGARIRIQLGHSGPTFTGIVRIP